MRAVRVLLLTLALAGLGGGGAWLVLASPVLAVERIDIVGVEGDLEAAVRTAITVPSGTPLATVDSQAVAEAVRAIPQVRTADVRRGWPTTLVVAVTERVPLAWVTAATVGRGDGVAVVDVEGVVIATPARRPSGLVQVTTVPSTAGGREALAVLEALPPDLARRVVSVGTASTTSVDSVRLVLRDRSVVVWGSREAGERKAQVLRALLPQQAAQYDVSAPDLPTTVPRR